MGQINVEKNVGGIEGLCVITPAVHGDARGYFMETYSQRDMEENGIDIRGILLCSGERETRETFRIKWRGYSRKRQ